MEDRIAIDHRNLLATRTHATTAGLANNSKSIPTFSSDFAVPTLTRPD
jgi:hypothetical protein